MEQMRLEAEKAARDSSPAQSDFYLRVTRQMGQGFAGLFGYVLEPARAGRARTPKIAESHSPWMNDHRSSHCVGTPCEMLALVVMLALTLSQRLPVRRG